KRIGNRFDWSHEVQTTDPAYYRWTQWIFIQLFKAGLAERRMGTVKWCPKDKTVLADEQGIARRCERCGSIVERRELEQGYFTIRRYAEQLLENLDWLDWSERVKAAQRHWIGRSEGVEIRFRAEKNHGEINRGERDEAERGPREEGSEATTKATPVFSESSATSAVNDHQIAVFTTRPDTIYGATFVVLAPDHPLVETLTDGARREAVLAYREEARVARITPETVSERPITGCFTGAYAMHPLTGERIPIWVADYVLAGYGTGA